MASDFCPKKSRLEHVSMWPWWLVHGNEWKHIYSALCSFNSFTAGLNMNWGGHPNYNSDFCIENSFKMWVCVNMKSHRKMKITGSFFNFLKVGFTVNSLPASTHSRQYQQLILYQSRGMWSRCWISNLERFMCKSSSGVKAHWWRCINRF